MEYVATLTQTFEKMLDEVEVTIYIGEKEGTANNLAQDLKI